MTYKTFTYDELYGLYTSAISREKEANRDWSTAAREWIGERDTLRAETARQSKELAEQSIKLLVLNEVVEERDALRAENERLSTALSSLEWTGGRYGGYCDLCDRTETEGHKEGCVMVGIDDDN